MRLRQIAVVVLVALVVAAGYWVLSDALRGLNVPPPAREPRFEERVVTEAPPVLETPPGMAERRGFWMKMLTTGDERDVFWAVTQLRRDGEAGRTAVLEAAQRSIRSNKALVQQALEFLLADPRPDCYPLARDVLESDDPHAVNRALLILAKLGTLGEPIADRLATLAVDREYPIPQYAMTALVAIGTDAAESAARDAVRRMEPGQRAFGYVAIAKLARPGVVEFLEQAFETEERPETRLGAAEGLVHCGRDLPLPWLREELDRAPYGSPHHEAVLRVLALARDEAALGVYTQRAEDMLETGKRRANALEALQPFEYAPLRATLVRCGRSGLPVDTRVEAWHQLVVKGPGSHYDDLRSMLLVPGPAASEDRRVAALVLGRLRRPDAASPLIDALARLDATERDERSLYLRALCLTGSPEAAETVARAVAADHAGFGLGGTAFDVYGVLGDLTPELRSALGAQFRRALAGELGELGGSGLQILLLAMPSCGSRDAAAAIERFVLHDEREIREAAVTALSFVGRPDSLPVLLRAWRSPQDDLLRDVLRDAIEKLQFLPE